MKARRLSRAVKRGVFILDDHPMTRYGLAQWLNSQPDLAVCGEAGSATEAFTALRKPPPPDLVLADITMSGKSGLEFIRDLKALQPEITVLVLSMHDEQIYAERALQAGAKGYLMKTEGGEQLLVAIRQVLEGKTYVSERMSALILDGFAQRRLAPNRAVLGELTGREFEVYQLIGQGLSTRQICDRLCLSVPTIGTHRAHIRRKLKLASGHELVQHAVRWAATQGLV